MDPRVAPGPGSDSIGGEERGRSLIDLLALVVRHRRLLVGLPLLAGAAAMAFSLLLPERYTVESRFVPETTGPQVGRLAGLAAQFGVDIGGGGGGAESVDFYAELLESQELLRSVVLTEFAVPAADAEGDTLRGNLVQLFEADGKSEEERVRNAVEDLADMVVVRPDPAAKLVTLRTSAPWPSLAVSVNQRLLDLLSEFNLQRRQSRAAAERRFLESRLQEAGVELREAEGVLQRFLSENRRYSESPQLAFEHGRLERRVDLLQQLYTSLAEGFEQARVDEVRNTPVITIIDRPRGPARKTAPRILVNGLLGALLGGLLAITIVVVREVLDAARRRDPERFEELRRATRNTAREFAPLRLFGRRRTHDGVEPPSQAGDDRAASGRSAERPAEASRG